MSAKHEATYEVSFGFMLPLSFALIGLKLLGVIDWSWLWVLCPIWIPIAVPLAIFAGMGILAFIGFALAMIIVGIIFLFEKVFS